MSTAPTNPTIPEGSPVPTWLPTCPKYEPREIEKDTVEELQKLGAPKIVYYVNRGEGATAPVSKDQHEIWFVSADWMHEYHGDSKNIVQNPELAMVEMKNAGVLDLPF
jgi:hypothetical protein